MATITSLAGARPSKDDRRGLSYSMDRVLRELENLRESPDNEDAVHDLRVSIRRCRSVARVMEDVDPDANWREMRRAAKKLFHGLGALRDAQVMKGWVQKLAPAGDPLATHLLNASAANETQLHQDALRAARKFDDKNWQHTERALRRRSRFVAVGSLAAECLALERFEAAKELHLRAQRTEKPKTWHALRKSVKEFRYTVENFLPEHHARWRENLKRVQDLLGDVHDLDVLAASMESSAGEEFESSLQVWRDLLARERSERITTYRQLTSGNSSLWGAWRHALPHGERLQLAAMARLRATARAADARPRRTRRTARIARAIFASLRRAKAGAVFSDPRARQLLSAAAGLHNVMGDNPRKSLEGKSPQKTAHKFLRSLAPPPGFPAADWAVLLATVRYHRGAEPREKSSAFSALSQTQKDAVRALAGVLRLAHALRKSGVEGAIGFRAESSAEAIILRVPGLPDSVEVASRLAAAKHLLEIYLGKPIVLRPSPVAAPAIETPAALSNPQPEAIHFAEASD